MADISFAAAYASVVEDPEEGFVFVGFAEGEDETENYVLFRQALTGGPVWFELGGEDFGAEDALLSVRPVGDALQIALRPDLAARFGFALAVEVGLAGCEDADEALGALREMLRGLWQEG
ncbi:MAG: hypothetical protein ACT4N9_06465 [Paracoccaceae bacterium]